MSSGSETVATAPAARNDAYANYPDLRLMKAFALAELGALVGEVEKTARAISAHAADFRKTCKRGLEVGYIDTCEKKCLAALMEVCIRIRRQQKRVLPRRKVAAADKK